jgi:hypothetical protein
MVAEERNAPMAAGDTVRESNGGVFISDGRCSVRLTRSGELQPDEAGLPRGYPTVISVRAGPFQGSVLDSIVVYEDFRKKLSVLYETLSGEAEIGSYDGNELALRGIGSQGAIEVRVKVVAERVPLIQMAFTFYLDQSYLPSIIQQLHAEFPPPLSDATI